MHTIGVKTKVGVKVGVTMKSLGEIKSWEYIYCILQERSLGWNESWYMNKAGHI